MMAKIQIISRVTLNQLVSEGVLFREVLKSPDTITTTWKQGSTVIAKEERCIDAQPAQDLPQLNLIDMDFGQDPF